MAQAAANTLERTRSDRGASAVEYALLIGMIAAAIVATVLILGETVTGMYDIEIPGF